MYIHSAVFVKYVLGSSYYPEIIVVITIILSPRQCLDV